MSDVAVVMARTSDFETFRREKILKDEAQDRALFAAENRCTALERTWTEFVAGREEEKKTAEKRWKAIMAVIISIGIDNLGYDLWSHAQPYLAPYMSKQFFWFSVTLVIFFLFTYGAWIGLNSLKRKKARDG